MGREEEKGRERLEFAEEECDVKRAKNGGWWGRLKEGMGWCFWTRMFVARMVVPRPPRKIRCRTLVEWEERGTFTNSLVARNNRKLKCGSRQTVSTRIRSSLLSIDHPGRWDIVFPRDIDGSRRSLPQLWYVLGHVAWVSGPFDLFAFRGSRVSIHLFLQDTT